MTVLEDIFGELGISQYLQDFIDQGFDTWETILDITESDFDALGVKLGHRRKLQRKIANSRGLSSDRALSSPGQGTPNDERPVEDPKLGSAKVDGRDVGAGVHGAKRKYRRHPKPDEHAPERPPSAYVIFSNRMREDLKGKHLSFTEIAKLVGENWQTLSPAEKEPYEHQAFVAKERYNNELNEYKKTEQYKEYARYLAEFKAKQQNQQQGQSNRTEVDASKRPKLDGSLSNGTASNVASPRSSESTNGQGRGESSGSAAGPWSSAQPSPSAPPASMPTLTAPHVAAPLPTSASSSSSSVASISRAAESRAASSPAVLPGYRESLYGVGAHALPWREASRDESTPSTQPPPRYVSISNPSDRPPSYSDLSASDSATPPGAGPMPHPRGPVISQAPPLLTSESTASASSTTSFFTPRTPMEPTVERPMHFPSLYPQKPPGNYENQLPPLRHPSLSPQSNIPAQQHSPNAIPPIMEFPTAMAPMRHYPANSASPVPAEGRDPRIRDLLLPEETNLDPVSALLKAGEIVNRTSRHPKLS